MYPTWRRSSARSFSGLRPSTSTSPPEGRRAPTRAFIRVVFPDPLGPTSPNTVPSGTVRSTPRNASIFPYRLVSPSTFMASTTTSWLFGREPPQEDPDRHLDVLLVGQAVFPYNREEQLASGLGKEHPHESPGARPRVVRAQPAKLDLARHVPLEESQHPLYHRAADQI